MNEDIEESAKLILENNRDTMIFWAVLVFTCVVGIIGLLPEINSIKSLTLRAIIQQACLFIIYVALLAGMLYSVYRFLKIYGESRELALSGRLGREIKNKANNKSTYLDKFIDYKWRMPISILVIIIVIIVFSLLYLTKIGLIFP
jgi:predicted RND superfamily exporter protein